MGLGEDVAGTAEASACPAHSCPPENLPPFRDRKTVVFLFPSGMGSHGREKA